MSTKALADALGITRRRQGLLVPQPSALPPNVPTAASSVAARSRKRKRSKKSGAVSAVTTVPSVQHAPCVGQTVSGIPSVQQAADPVTNVPPNSRQNGQCTQCLRVLSLTSSGLLHAHGHGCLGSSQPPVAGSITTVACLKRDTQSAASSAPVNGTNASATAHQSPSDIMEMLRRHRCRVLKRVPKASRIPAAEKLASTLQQVVANPDDILKWTELLLFTFSCLGVPGQRGGKRHLSSLASKVNQAIANFPTVPPPDRAGVQHSPKLRTKPDDLAARVSRKIEDGDVRGAIRLTASDAVLAPFDDVTAAALQIKHPARSISDSPTPPPSTDSPILRLLESDILAAVKSFVPGSAGGPDGLRPQHLKDLTSASAGDAGQRLLTRLTDFANLCLSGRVPAGIQPVFCGASLGFEQEGRRHPSDRSRQYIASPRSEISVQGRDDENGRTLSANAAWLRCTTRNRSSGARNPSIYRGPPTRTWFAET